jgi:hypothetical protein
VTIAWALEAFACNGLLTECSLVGECAAVEEGNVALWRENVQGCWTNDVSLILKAIHTCISRCH